MNKRLKILMVNFEFPPIGGGGGKTHLRLLEQFSHNENLEIDVLTSSPEPGLFEENFSDNIRIIKVGIHKKNLHRWTKIETIEWLWRAGKIYKLMINRNDYNLAHAFFGFPTGWLCWRNRGKLPYIVSLLGSDVPGDNPRFSLDYKLLAPLFKSIWKNATSLITCSEGLRDRAKRFYPKANIQVITNGIDLTKFYPTNTSHCENVRLITTGRLSESKRIELLIEALSKMNSLPNLKIIGSGSEEAKLRSLAEKLGVTERVEFVSRVEAEQMPELYRNSDIYVSATSTEGMSNSMLEAMASGLPIVTTEYEGASELVKDNGVITKSNSESIANSIDSLIDNPTQIQSMSQAALELAKKFTWQGVAESYLTIYREFI